MSDETTPQQNPWARDIHADRFKQDKFYVNRKLLSMGNKYYVYDEYNNPLFFIDRPMLALKSQFTVYDNDSKSTPLLRVNQESALAIMNYTFVVQDADGRTIGTLKRQGWQSLIRRVWEIHGAHGDVIATAMEDSLPKALLRRVIGEHSLIGMLVRTNFILTRGSEAEAFGEFNRRLTLTDKHILDLTRDPARTFDRRLALALAIVLDNTEHQR
jgi:uncharacterized protein YxjI